MSDFQAVISSPRAAYDEALRFFNGTGMLNDALGRIAADLDKKNIDYVVIGALALAGIWYVAALRRRLRDGTAGIGSSRPDPVEIA